MNLFRLPDALAANAASNAIARDALAGLPRRVLGGFDLRPFLIYQVPDLYRYPAEEDSWRKFRVRGGVIFVNGTLVEVTGTDGAHDDPFEDSYPDGEFDITADDDTEKFWFWINIANADTTPTASIASDAEPPESGWDSTHIPIGWVNTKETGIAKIRPLLWDLFTVIC